VCFPGMGSSCEIYSFFITHTVSQKYHVPRRVVSKSASGNFNPHIRTLGTTSELVSDASSFLLFRRNNKFRKPKRKCLITTNKHNIIIIIIIRTRNVYPGSINENKTFRRSDDCFVRGDGPKLHGTIVDAIVRKRVIN